MTDDLDRLWKDLAEELQYHHGGMSFEFLGDYNRGKLLRSLQEHAVRFRAYERRHPEYRPGGSSGYEDEDGNVVIEGEWDVCAVLHLLRVALELASEVNRAHLARTMCVERQRVVSAQHESARHTHH
jgi:hypothetical protein